MRELRFTLVTDGSSDGTLLIPVLEWILRRLCGSVGIKVVYADPGRCRKVPKGLQNRIKFALRAYPCECLLIHRDAERDPPNSRRQEIQTAVDSLDSRKSVAHVCVVPIRMTEAWLLFDEYAIRRASGNPNGEVPLEIPRLADIEKVPDPKRLLHDLLTTASELHGRRLKSFEPRTKTRLVARSLDDFSALRQLTAFQALENDLRWIIEKNRWGFPGDSETATIP